MLKYRGYQQSGRGLGNVLGKLLRAASPLITKGVGYILPHAARFGSRVLDDIATGGDAMEAVKKRAKQTGKAVVDELLTSQRGRGVGHIQGVGTPKVTRVRKKPRTARKSKTTAATKKANIKIKREKKKPVNKRSKKRKTYDSPAQSKVKRSRLSDFTPNDIFEHGY
jgi:hypothetical protein